MELDLLEIQMLRNVRSHKLPESSLLLASLLDKKLICYYEGRWLLTRKGREIRDLLL